MTPHVCQKPTIEELHELQIFRGLTTEQLQWMLDHSETVRLDAGETVYQDGAPAESMFILVTGAFQLRFTMGGQPVVLGTSQPGFVTGLLPYSRMAVYGGAVVTTEPACFLRVHKSDFTAMLAMAPDLGQRLVAIMSDRVREATKTQQHREKMMALGKLSAGLAHELNNPAAALRNAASALEERLAKKAETFAALLGAGLTAEQARECDVIRLRVAARGKRELSTLERGECEEHVGEWLEEHGVSEPWMLAETFVEAGYQLTDLEAIASAVPPGAAAGMLRWIESHVAAERLASEVLSAAGRISELVRSIKSFSHMDRAPDKQPVAVHDGLDTTLVILGHKLRRKSVRVEKDYDSNLPVIEAYPGELNQVWTNLVDNAIDALPDSGAAVLTLQTRREGDYIVVKVIDNGKGIPPEFQRRIFEPFFTTKGIGEGTGLGLDIVDRIVSLQHQGTISVQSQPGHTEFAVRLPVQSARALPWMQ